MTKKRKRKGKHASPYHEACALLHEFERNPHDSRPLRKAMSIMFGIVMSASDSTATQGREPDTIYKGHMPAFRFECIDAAHGPSRYAIIGGGRITRIDDESIPFGGRYAVLTASAGNRYCSVKIPLRRFLANLKSIDRDSSISAYCMLRGIDLRYDPYPNMKGKLYNKL